MPPDLHVPFGRIAEWFELLGPVAWPLTACAVGVLAIIFERTVFFARHRAKRARIRRDAENALRERQDLAKPVRDDWAAIELSVLRAAMLSGARALRLFGMVSPLLGLLGTILGIIAAFQVIAVQSGPVSPGLIADGLWEAMLTTAVGLCIALPALVAAHVCHALCDTEIDNLARHLNRLSLEIENHRFAGTLPKEPDAPTIERLRA